MALPLATTQSQMTWMPVHTLMLVLSPLAIFAFFYSRRYQTDADSQYDKTIQRFRIALLISGIGGLLGLLRLWLTIRHN